MYTKAAWLAEFKTTQYIHVALVPGPLSLRTIHPHMTFDLPQLFPGGQRPYVNFLRGREGLGLRHVRYLQFISSTHCQAKPEREDDSIHCCGDESNADELCDLIKSDDTSWEWPGGVEVDTIIL